jgi:hypothetical protein
MNTLTTKRSISKACLFGGIVAMSGACYALGVSEDGGDRSAMIKEARIIGSGQRSAFLAYVARRQMHSASLVGKLSAGDVLPQEGVSYYDISLGFGAGLNRCVFIAGKAAIVDPRTRRVIEVIE